MEAISYIVSGQLAYLALPSDGLRQFADGLFPHFAKFPIADSQAVGWGHRYRAGHDLFLDVPATTINHGVVDGYKHAGHIVLTDFPTKAGVPIPGFSQSGLGQWLESIGIARGWLNINICDAGVGIIAVAEGTPDLVQALNGHLVMDASTFFDTYAEGGIEVALAVYMSNPILLAGGIENILSGVVSTWNTISVYVDPFLFFGSSFSSALIGFVLGHAVANQTLQEAFHSAIRGGTVGALYSVSTAFGFGAISGLLAIAAGRALAQHHRQAEDVLLVANKDGIRLFVEEITRAYPSLPSLLKATEGDLLNIKGLGIHHLQQQIINAAVVPLAIDSPCLPAHYRMLSTGCGEQIIQKEPDNFLHLAKFPMRGDSEGDL